MLCALRGSRSTLWARGITPPCPQRFIPACAGELPCYAPSMLVLVFAWLALCALCAWGIVYFGLGLLAELFAPEDPDD